MLTVNDVKPLSGTLAFRLGVVGTVVANRFGEHIVELGLKPKHAGLLVALSAGAGASQQELAQRMGVAPSLVVTLADHLEGMGAIERVRDAADRRRQNLALTDRGRDLLVRCARISEKVGDELTAGLDEADRERLSRLLGKVAAAEGLPT
jgi:DNA-binding MarR family transcriptional regulator